MEMNKVILYELNEVPLRIFDYYRKMRPNSWIAANFDSLKKFESFTENGGHLSPWQTWPTVHRGVTNHKHLISDFNQDLSEVDKEFPPIWQLLAKSGVKVGVFGSLHSYPLPANLDNYDFYVPDVFATGSECFPKNVELFQEINLTLSRKSARNVDSSVPLKEAWRLLSNLSNLGFKAGTLADVGSHLVQERMDRWKTVRRRTYQTVLAFDVFYKLLRTKKPDFVTFFTNHVASSMHRYWAAVFPDEYENLRFDQEWINTYDNEILFTMDKTDAMLRKLAGFVQKNPEYKLLITSSMGQNAVECEPMETQLYVKDHNKFLAAFDLQPGDFEVPVAMLLQFNYKVNDGKLEAFKTALEGMRINGNRVIWRDLGFGKISIDMGQANLKEVDLVVNGKHIAFAESGLENVEIEDKSSATAYHIPEGHQFVYHPSFGKQGMAETGVSTIALAPTLLQNFSAPVPEYMTAPAASIL